MRVTVQHPSRVSRLVSLPSELSVEVNGGDRWLHVHILSLGMASHTVHCPLDSLPLLNYTHCPSVFCEIIVNCPLKEFVKLCIITIFTQNSFPFLIKQTGTIKKIWFSEKYFRRLENSKTTWSCGTFIPDKWFRRKPTTQTVDFIQDDSFYRELFTSSK